MWDWSLESCKLQLGIAMSGDKMAGAIRVQPQWLTQVNEWVNNMQCTSEYSFDWQPVIWQNANVEQTCIQNKVSNDVSTNSATKHGHICMVIWLTGCRMPWRSPWWVCGRWVGWHMRGRRGISWTCGRCSETSSVAVYSQAQARMERNCQAQEKNKISHWMVCEHY